MTDLTEQEKWECHHCEKMTLVENMIEVDGYFFCSADCSSLYNGCCGDGSCETSPSED